MTGICTKSLRAFLKKQPVPGFMLELDRSLPSLWFCDNRLTMQLGQEGPRSLNYYGHMGNSPELLTSKNDDFFECLRPDVKVGFDRYTAEEGRLVVAPFGFYREQEFPEEQFNIRTGVWLVEDSVVFSFDLTGKPDAEAHGEITVWVQCFKFLVGRSWDDWSGDCNVMSRKGMETIQGNPPVSTFLSLAASGILAKWDDFSDIDIHASHKYRFSTPLKAGQTAFIVLAVGTDKAETEERSRRIARNANSVVLHQFQRFQEVVDRMPRMKSESPMLDRFVFCMPLYEEALKVPEIPGARRVKTSSAWIWLWDSILPALLDPYHGDVRGILDMSHFHMKFAHMNGGVPLAYPIDIDAILSPEGDNLGDDKYMSIQGLVQIMVHDAVALTGHDELLQELYGGVRSHFKRIAASSVGDTGLLPGLAAFPDARALMDENDETFSAFNNGCWYNACRKMERMALAMDDADTAKQARNLALAIEKNFWPTFWNKKEGYIGASATPTLHPQDVFSTTATFWDFGFGDELSDGYQQKIVQYQLEHFYSPMCITIFSPQHTKYWDRDGNQFHCSWPVMDSHNLKLGVWAKNNKSLPFFLPWLESMMSRHSMSEAIQARVRKSYPVIYDQGSWYSYSGSSWYRVIVECLLGVTFDEGGVTLCGTTAPPMCMEGLYFRGGCLKISTEGTGWNVSRIIFDGKPVEGTNKIAAELLEGASHDLKIMRDPARSKCWRVIGANGSSITEVKANPKLLSFKLCGTGLSRVLLEAPGLGTVQIDGELSTFGKAEHNGFFWIEKVLKHRQSVNVHCTTT